LAQRNIEWLIGRLITDEDFRARFLANPELTLLGLCERGIELSQTEIAALVNTDRAIWSHAAGRLDARLQKASLEGDTNLQKERDDHV
jgi:hypothetical protein